MRIEFDSRVLTCVVICFGYLHHLINNRSIEHFSWEASANSQFSQDSVHVASDLDVVAVGEKRDALDEDIQLPYLANIGFFGGEVFVGNVLERPRGRDHDIGVLRFQHFMFPTVIDQR